MARLDVHHLRQWLTVAGESGYSLNRFCQRMEISQRQFGRYTQKLFQCSPQHWLDQQRMMIAPGLLRKYRCIKSVAFRLGFKQASHFSREFKLHHGLTATKFLERNDSQSEGNGEIIMDHQANGAKQNHDWLVIS